LQQQKETIVHRHGENIEALRQHFQQQDAISAQDFSSILNDASSVLKNCVKPGTPSSSNGLIYGHIQSGKTAIIITTIALALDNGYRNFIVLTSDLNDLYNQTLERVRTALHSTQVFGKLDFRQTGTVSPQSPLVFVSSKNPRVLARLSARVRQLGREGETFLIVDDEADQASLNTNINRVDAPPSGVNREIIALTQTLSSHTFLQTTATPQALLLQDNNSIFRPSFVVVTKPGTGYVGGDYFFNPTSTDQIGFGDYPTSRYHICLVDPIDVERLRTSSTIPDSVARSVYSFFLGAAALRMRGTPKNYTYLLHTSLKQTDHALAAELVNDFVTSLMTQLAPRALALTRQTDAGLKAAYDDLARSFGGLPPLRDLISEISTCINSTEVCAINARTGIGVKQNQDRRHTLYIGGTKIGRGVTVKNLLVTFYGRDAANPQVDTVLQHARMYGYRQGELPAIRIYLPQTLAERFREIHEADNAMRALCTSTGKTIRVIRVGSRMRPTRINVLNQRTVDVRAYLGGRKYFPLVPVSNPDVLEDQTSRLDKLLSDFPEQQKTYDVTINKLLQILDFKFKVPGSPGAWEDELIRQAFIGLKKKCKNRGTLVIVNLNSDLKKASTRKYEELGSVLPGNVDDPPYGASAKHPALYMTRLTGKSDSNGGWHGVPFWVPLVRFPDGNFAIAANYT
jgi:hypothetical protein